MFNFKTKLLSAIFACLLFASPASAEYFSDVILTGTQGIWMDSRSYASLQAAVTAAGAGDREIVIIGAQAATTLVVPANVRLKFLRDGSINNTGQLTINTRNIAAEDRQIFTGTGDIDFIDGSVVRSSWFSNAVEALDVTLDDSLTIIISEPGHITANSAVGNDVTLRWESSDNNLIVYGGRVLSNVKDISAENYQIFAGAGDIDFLDGTELYLSWFRRLRSVLTWVEAEEVSIIVNEDSAVEYTQASSSNETIRFLPGGMLSPNGGVTLTLNSLIDCDTRQVFSGAGTVTFGADAIRDTYPEWWGGAGDGATNNRIPIQNAIDSLSEGVVHFSTGLYLVFGASPNLTLKSSIVLVGDGEGLTTIRGGDLLYTDAVTYTALGGGITSGAITMGDKSITTANITGISEGNLLLFTSTDSPYWLEFYGGVSYQAEVLKVIRITGTTLLFSEPFKDSYIAANTTINNLSTEANKNITIKDMTLDLNSAGHGVYFNSTIDSEIVNVEIINIPVAHIGIAIEDGSYNVWVRNCKIDAEDVPAESGTYGVLFTGPVQACGITGSQIQNPWHSVAHGGEYLVRETIIDNSFLRGAQWGGAAYDAHENTTNVLISDSVIDGVNIRGHNLHFIGNTIYNNVDVYSPAPVARFIGNHFIALSQPEGVAGGAGSPWWAIVAGNLSAQKYDVDLEFIGNKFESYAVDYNDAFSLGFISFYGADTAASYDYTGLKFIDNEFIDKSSKRPDDANAWRQAAICWYGPADYAKAPQFDTIVVRGNKFYGPSTYVYLYRLLGRNIVVSDNEFHETTYYAGGTSYHGPGYALTVDCSVKTDEVGKLRITNNIFNKVEGGIDCVSIDNAADTRVFQDVRVSGNTIYALNFGIHLLWVANVASDLITNLSVQDNIVTSATTGIFLSGAGNTKRLKSATVTGNIVEGLGAASLAGIFLEFCGDCLVEDNQVDATNIPVNLPGIKVQNVINAIVAQNISSNSTGHGIKMNEIIDGLCFGNMAFDNAQAGIYIDDVDHLQIVGNHCRSNDYGVRAVGVVTGTIIKTGNLLRNNTTAQFQNDTGSGVAADD